MTDDERKDLSPIREDEAAYERLGNLIHKALAHQEAEPFREPTLEEVRGGGPNLLDFDFAQAVQQEAVPSPICEPLDADKCGCSCHEAQNESGSK